MNWSTQQIRKTFLDYFESKGHKVVPSAPMVVKNDPTLMFTNAGMNQFKDIFLGNEKAPHSRVADTQKCLRVSGKHNDLEEVGVDTYHHTMFEMLGNWSFNDYFKTEAIGMAWELLTDVYKIDKDRLYVTVFGGDQEDNTAEDTEAFDIWSRHITPSRILKCSKKDNFWEMGDAGPCGPCSEIHVDIRTDEERKKQDGKSLVNMDHPQVIEVWNLVFIQFNRNTSGELNTLPQKHVDTGMGLERLAMVLQGKQSNYEIDLFRSIISKLEEISSTKYTAGTDKASVAFRVIADHLRAISFAIADGQLPSNNGAGYVIRRILRRAVRYGYSFLNLDRPFIYELVPDLADLMGVEFDELHKQLPFIQSVIKEEEQGFLRTLDNGIKRLNLLMEGQTTIEGASAFELYDTYGFPIDLTQLIASEKNISVDLDGFNQELLKQKVRSRSSNTMDSDDWVILKESEEKIEFVGYELSSCDVELLRYRKVSQKGKDYYQLVFNKTPFYPEGGGQVGDTGLLKSESESLAIIDTKKENDLIIHITTKLPSKLSGIFKAEIDKENRAKTTCNHSATHLLHHALREVLGIHVEQRGSLVNPEHLRFDFSHFQKLTEDELKRVEELVNMAIQDEISLNEKRNTPLKVAQEMGAMSLFGEKYGETVRVIQFGNSIELCGGTHVNNLLRIRGFKIISETSIAAGIRRIEAITSTNLDDYYENIEKTLKAVESRFVQSKDVVNSLDQVLAKLSDAEKQIEVFQNEKVKAIKNELKSEFIELNGIKRLISKVNLTAAQVKDISFQLKAEYDKAIIILGYVQDGKAGLSILFSESLVSDQLNANKLIKEAGKFIQGGGGGQPFYATAGGKNPNGLDDAITYLSTELN